jgi:hypothetical protein
MEEVEMEEVEVEKVKVEGALPKAQVEVLHEGALLT